MLYKYLYTIQDNTIPWSPHGQLKGHFYFLIKSMTMNAIVVAYDHKHTSYIALAFFYICFQDLNPKLTWKLAIRSKAISWCRNFLSAVINCIFFRKDNSIPGQHGSWRLQGMSNYDISLQVRNGKESFIYDVYKKIKVFDPTPHETDRFPPYVDVHMQLVWNTHNYSLEIASTTTFRA